MILNIITQKSAVSIIGFLTAAIALSKDDIFKAYILYAPLFLIITIIIDRGRGEYCLRRGLSSEVEKELLGIILKFSTLLLVTNGIFIVYDLPIENNHLFAILTVQAIAQAYSDIYIKHFTHKNSSIRHLLQHQLTTAIFISIGVLGGHFGKISEKIALLVLAIAPFIWPILHSRANSKKKENEKSNSLDENQKIPTFSLLDLSVKLAPILIYGILLALKNFIEDVEFMARAFLFATGILTIYTITKRTSKNNVQFALLSFILVVTSYFALKIIPIAWAAPHAEIAKIFTAIFFQTNPLLMLVGITLTMASVSLYSWNQER